MSELELEVEECRNVPENRVIAVARAHGTGAGSGATVVSRRFTQVAEFRDGLVVAVWLYGDMASALKATGLARQPFGSI